MFDRMMFNLMLFGGCIQRKRWEVVKRGNLSAGLWLSTERASYLAQQSRDPKTYVPSRVSDKVYFFL